MERLKQVIIEGEEGHANVGIASLIPAAGAIVLGIGAANDTGWMAVAGGIVLGLGLVAHELARHSTIDKGIYGRLDRIDNNRPLDK